MSLFESLGEAIAAAMLEMVEQIIEGVTGLLERDELAELERWESDGGACAAESRDP